MSVPVQKVEAGFYTVGPFEITKNEEAEICYLEEDRDFWFLDLPVENVPSERWGDHGAYGRYATKREAVEEAQRQLAGPLKSLKEAS